MPHPAITADVLAGVIQTVAGSAWFATVGHTAKPKGWDITWGAQVDPRVVRLTDDGQITDVAVASYLAKYATKSTEPVGVPPGRITADNVRDYANPRTHQGRLIAACLKLGNHPHEDFKALRRWRAHARLPRPLRHQEPPLLHNYACAADSSQGLAPPPEPPHPGVCGQDRDHGRASGVDRRVGREEARTA
jgi:hypothetical protein